ncbi:MAG TPA: hypothetical protein VFR14_11635 [Candidatus Limnocylindrales bacterium]|nr:hypothetical protein [Candidatus Limnocylindrales bacterium]
MGADRPTPDRGSAGWRWFFRIAYRFVRLADPLLRAVIGLVGPFLPRAVDLEVVGRRSGHSRRVLLTLLTVDDAWFVGHPNGPAPWTRNLEAAGVGRLTLRDGRSVRVRPVRLWGGPERESVIRATWSQQPFPANVAYALARRHIRRVGVYYRLIELPDDAAADQPTAEGR